MLWTRIAALLTVCIHMLLLNGAMCMHVTAEHDSRGRRTMHPWFPILRGSPAEQRLPVVQRMRGGSGSGDAQGSARSKGLLVIDLGAQNTRAAMSALPGCIVPGLSPDGLAMLVQVRSVRLCAHYSCYQWITHLTS